MQRRRRFIGTVSSLAAAGLAGCLSRDSDDEPSQIDQPANQDDRTPSDEPADGTTEAQTDRSTEDPAELMESFLRTQVDVVAARQEFYHSAVEQPELEVLDIAAETVEREVDVEMLAEVANADADDLESSLAGEETARVELEFETREGSERRRVTEEWFVATDDSEWRVIDRGAREETGTESTDQVADNVNVISEVGTVGAHDAADDQIGELRVGLQPAAGADEIDLADLSLQYVSENDFANIIAGSDDGEPATAETHPDDIEIDGLEGERYDVDVVTAESEDDLLMTDSDDRYELVLPLSDEQENLSPLVEGEEVEMTITTGVGAQTIASMEVPDPLSEDEGTNVAL